MIYYKWLLVQSLVGGCMKKCKCCQSEIDAKAKICPICKKKQNKNGMWILIGILAIIFIPYFVGKNAEEKSK